LPHVFSCLSLNFFSAVLKVLSPFPCSLVPKFKIKTDRLEKHW
jgi:hypothetical protein